SDRRSRARPARLDPACGGPRPRSRRPDAARARATGRRTSPSASEARRRRHQSEMPKVARKRKEKEEKGWQKKQKKKFCVFCKEKIDHVDYKDVNMLRKFVSDRGKIRARRVSGNCTQHQRDVATAVKNAREMALLPYTSTAR